MSLLLKALNRKKKSRGSFVAQFPYREDDIVLASYPKSGSTWLRFIVTALQADGEIDFLKTQLSVPELSNDAVRHGVDFEALPRPRFMRTHAEYIAQCPRVIYLLRDGRDVMVSFYFHYRKFQAFAGTFLEFLNHDNLPWKWDNHVESWIFSNPTLERVCVLRYEALLADTFGEVKKALRFAGVSIEDEQLRKAINECTFEKMKAVEKQHGLGYTDPGDPKIAFVRKGGHGNWRELFGDAEKQAFKERYGKALVKCGYESSLDW